MNRRALLLSALACPLAACGLTPATLTQLQQDATLILNVLNEVAPILIPLLGANVPSVTADLATANAAIDAGTVALKNLAGATSTNLAADETMVVNQIDALEPIAEKYLPTGSQALADFEAAVDLLPAILTVVPLVAMRRRPRRTVEQARAALAHLGR
jgi:hypothetical protein